MRVGRNMMKKTLGAGLVLLCLSPSVLAQELPQRPHRAHHATTRAGRGETLDASMARLAVKAAFTPSAQPTRQELLNVILLMSLREQRGSGT
jgi:hypothetical protein